ncbi:hypothetical protein TGPRC2_425410 [Toxoplasma gondii TgCatPRC2]|uniref:Uncharacterized protein n=1 Tax=Toxoplasma gondii TgCatPRC2 TaxID=1130821 RepID=A0A151HBI6_TOXGO|nr:hypothetical protein TGPRC2_425410 [Toxoplasma gondii TgCatPRC2]
MHFNVYVYFSQACDISVYMKGCFMKSCMQLSTAVCGVCVSRRAAQLPPKIAKKKLQLLPKMTKRPNGNLCCRFPEDSLDPSTSSLSGTENGFPKAFPVSPVAGGFLCVSFACSASPVALSFL